MRIGSIIAAVLAISTLGYAEFIDSMAARTDPAAAAAATAPAPPAEPIPPATPPTPVNLGRHHVSLGLLGYFKAGSGDFELPAYGFDGSVGQSGFLNYRYTFHRNLDIVADVRGWISEATVNATTITTTVAGFGAGVRYTAGGLGGIVFPYVQASVLSIGETVSGSAGSFTITASSDQGLGAAVAGGAELRLGRLVSIPVEAMYLFGKPADDVSGFGVTAGVSFNWGRIE